MSTKRRAPRAANPTTPTIDTDADSVSLSVRIPRALLTGIDDATRAAGARMGIDLKRAQWIAAMLRSAVDTEIGRASAKGATV